MLRANIEHEMQEIEIVYDDHMITYLTFGSDKEIKEISLADNDKAIDELKVQPLSSLVQIAGVEPARSPTGF